MKTANSDFTMRPTKIKTIEDVCIFFRHIYSERNTWFHPDDSFTEYIDPVSKDREFSDEESKIYNDLMKQAFLVCDEFDRNLIYEIGMQIVNEGS